MKKQVLLVLLASLALRALAYDFQSWELSNQLS